jgi:uncharacterized membrane protein
MKSLATRNAILALIITLLIIGSVIYAVSYLDQKRVAELSTLQNQLTTDTLSVETQLALLETAPLKISPFRKKYQALATNFPLQRTA